MLYFGWLPDLPDMRDYTRAHEEVSTLIKIPKKLPSKIDLKKYCSPIANQGRMGSCTAHAASGMVEYFQRKTFGKHASVSRSFIYKTTRNLMGVSGDTGAYIRSTMGALALFGSPPEKYWEYDEKMLDSEPPSFCYAYASNYQAIKYFRLDEKGSKEEETLKRVKENLSTSLPVMFGFTVYDSIRDAQDGKIPFPEKGERVLGGHAVLAVGYDDKMKIGKEKGAFTIRNSWGKEWGDKGYGYLPYKYLLEGLALDWWSMVNAEWVDAEAFE